MTFVEDMRDIEDQLFKISYSDFNGGPTVCGSLEYLQDKFGEELSIQPSGGVWIDSMHKSVNKGEGVKALQEILGITDQETLVFGDYYNDIPMLENAKNVFVVANAPEDVKKYAARIVKSNDEYGVTESIKEFVLK